MRVFVPESYSASSLARLKANNKIQLVEKIEDTEVLLIRSQTRVDATLLKNSPDLKLVITATSGFDHIDWKLCEQKGITAAFTPEANANATAELTLFLMASLLRKTLTQIQNAKQGRWREGLTRGEGLEGKTLGIVGLGRVGSKVARLAKAYDMNVLGFDPYAPPSAFEGLERLSLIELLRTSDIVSLHVPLTKETKNLINLATLEEMPSGVFLINASRGAAVDESEVLVALRNGHLAGAAFDVLEREPPVYSNELLHHPRVIVTPHVGAFTTQAFERASNAAVDRLFRYLEGQTISDTLPLTTPWFEHCV